MAEVNLDRLRELSAEMRRVIHELRALGEAREEQFIADAKAVNGAKYLFMVAREAAIDICKHLAAQWDGRGRDGYGDPFQVLKEMGVLDVELSKRVARMAKLRSVLVYLYSRAGNARIYRAIHHDLPDYELYLGAIDRYLSQDIGSR